MLTRMETLAESLEKDRISLSQVHALSHQPVIDTKEWSFFWNKHTQPGGHELELLNEKGHIFSLPEERIQRRGVYLSNWKKERAVPASFQQKKQHVSAKELSQLSTICVSNHNMSKISWVFFFYLIALLQIYFFSLMYPLICLV